MEELNGSGRPGLEGWLLPGGWGKQGEEDAACHLLLTAHTLSSYSQPACLPAAWLYLAQGDAEKDRKGLISHSYEAPASGPGIPGEIIWA